MAGMPGSGKSTLARALAATTAAVVLDKDVIQSSALRTGFERELSGPLAYEVLFDLAAELARQGHSIIADSAAFFPTIIEKGRRIAEENGFLYRVIECVCTRDLLQNRLSLRESRTSQWGALLDIDLEARPGAEPLSIPRLIVDTALPLPCYLELALKYINDG
ncbi:MAG TPA: AAA family ATPase [Gemmatimonadaceae bacterium]|nr:AAA family ATPase [Gemmatimonadaceae bacterium]